MPAADEVWRLQRGTDRECRFFQAMADKGHYGGGQGTRQGIYVCSSSGDFLASINSLNPDTVITTLETALRKWQQLPETVRRRGSAANPMPAHRWETSYPDHGLVLVSVNRDLVAEQSDVRRTGDRWNRDHVWFSAEEARSWLPADPIPGTVHQLPEPLVRRLARFHLVDNVRGQTLPFAVQEVYGSEIQTEVLERRGQLVRLRISGVTMAVAEGPWLMGDNDWKPPREFPRTVAVQLLGYATYDLAQTVFTEFEVIAVGHGRGYTQNNDRSRGPQEGTIGFVFTLAEDTPAERV
ncbi:MAG: hypothetical protein IIA66_08760, partial [Planctomycetes bacterium]|nr:hypothetical protein [Planctomycetota bacterium]